MSDMTMDNSVPRVSVVIPCFNAERFIARAIDSVLAQTQICPEVIVIDDGSTDGSLEEIKRFGERIIWESGPNRGGPVARNAGLALASGDYVIFLDADDFFDGEFLRGLVDAMHTTGCDFALGRCDVANRHAVQNAKPMPDTSSAKAFLIDWITGKWLPPAAVLWKTAVVREIGGWRVDIKRNQDGELIYRAVLAGHLPALSAKGRAVYWQHPTPTRINNTVSDASILSSFAVMRELIGKLDARYPHDAEVRAALSYATHALQRNAALNNLHKAEADIRQFRRDKGYAAYEGSPLEQIFARIFGLGRKERLLRTLRKVRRRSKTVALILIAKAKSMVTGHLPGRTNMEHQGRYPK